MRRMITVVLVAFSLVALAIPAASAKYVANSQSSESYVEGGWSSGDWGDEALTSGYASARLPKGAKVGDIYFSESHGTRTWCEANPEDPDDDYLGYVWTTREGWGPATVAVGKSYSAGAATGIAEVWTYTYSDCDWWGEMAPNNGGGSSPEFVEVTISMAADSALMKETGKYSFHIPGEYNDHGSSRSIYRYATGEVTVDGEMHMADWGMIGMYSWKSHTNSK